MLQFAKRRVVALVSKPKCYRFDDNTINKLSAWKLLLNKDKTEILKEAFKLWENNQTEEERKKVNIILKQLNNSQ